MLLFALVAYTAVFFFAARALPGVKLQQGIGPALGLALVFGLLNVFLGWAIKFGLVLVLTTLSVLTLGLALPLFALLGTAANAVLLKVADALLPGFELDGWAPAFVLGFLLALAGVALRLVAGA